MERCGAIQGNGVRCSSFSYDRSGKCGRHGGISQRQWRINMRVLQSVQGGIITPSFLRPPSIVRESSPVDKVFVFDRKDGYCLVCFDEISGCCILPCCKQTCCEDCLQGWLNTKKRTCPHCRKTL